MKVSRYTPSLLCPENLEAIFVQRHSLAQKLVELVQESVMSQNKHYSLLIGPRGIGKTHLLSLVYHRVKELPNIQGQLKIAWLREEEWGVSSFFDLVLRILRALYEADPGSELEERTVQLYEMSVEWAETESVQILRDYLGKRTLLILMENLDEIFQGLGDEGQKKLRSFLQELGCCTIIATSQSLFDGVKLQTSPFYGFFRIRYLKDLSVDVAVNLLQKIAELEGNQDLARFLATVDGRSRVQAVHHLAGGNPRIYVVFSEFLTRESLDALIQPFIQMLDDLTPYYQARMSWLSPQQRKIIEILCGQRYAMPVKDIAQKCFATPQSISSQLKDLKDKGYVLSETYGRQAFYELREPLMRICLAVKQVRGEPIGLIVEFLRTWYSRQRLEELSYDLSSQLMRQSEKVDKTTGNLWRDYLRLALEESAETDTDPRVLACFDEISRYAPIGDYKSCLEPAKKIVQLRGNSSDYSSLGVYQFLLGNHLAAIASLDKSLELNPKNALTWQNRGAFLFSFGRYEESALSYDKALEINPKLPFAWINRGNAFGHFCRYEDAIASYDKAIESDPELSSAWINRGNVCNRLGLYTEAIASYDKAIASYDKAVDFNSELLAAWFNRGGACSRLGDYTEAIASYDKVLSVNSEFPWARLCRAESRFAIAMDNTSVNELEKELKALPDNHKKREWSFDVGIRAIFISYHDKSDWRKWLIQIKRVFESQNFLSAMTKGLTQHLNELVSEMVSQTAAETWRDVWQDLVGDRPEFQIPLRLLNAVVAYKKAPNDPRVFLSLAVEERKILQQILGVVDKADSGAA